MNSGYERSFLLNLDVGVSTAFLVHPILLVTARHKVEVATRGAVFAGERRVTNIAKVYKFENLPKIDLAFVEIRDPIVGAYQLGLTMKKLRVGDYVKVCGYPDSTGNKLTSVCAKVCRVLDDEVSYDLQKKLVRTPYSLNGASGAPVFKERTSKVSAIHLGSFFPEPAGTLPIIGYATPSFVIHELLRSLVGNNYHLGVQKTS